MIKRSAEVGPLLPPQAFDALREALAGKSVHYIPPLTRNVGTGLTIRGTIQFFRDNDVRVRNDWERDELPDPPGDIDYIVYGGGLVGTVGEKGAAARRWIVNQYLHNHNLTLLALPMTHMGGEEPRPPGEFLSFAREDMSLKRLPSSRLSPDLAFYWSGKVPCHSTDGDLGIFLREDPLSFVSKHWQKGLGDPVRFVNTIDEYFDLASRFEAIKTDRLMFAVCGLLLGREVTLLPDDSGKNRAIYETWLSSTPCQWSEPGVRLQ